MKQLNNSNYNRYKLDNRTEEDLRKELKTLAKNYVPEWRFTEENPDIGSVIGMIFAKQMSETIAGYNDILDQYQVDLANMQGISLRPAIPASSMVVMELSEDSIEGVEVSKGEKLLAENGEGRIVFETTEDVFVTNSRIKSLFMTSHRDGKIIPVFGDFKKTEIIPLEEQEITEPDMPQELEEFGLFDFSQKGIEQNVVLIYHSYMFDVENNEIEIEFVNGEFIVSGLKNGKYVLKYYTEDGFKEFDKIRYISDEKVGLFKSDICKKVEFKEGEYSLILLEAIENPTETLEVSEVKIVSKGAGAFPEAITNGTNDLTVENFLPFGDTLALYKEFYILHNEYFSKPGATVTINFNVNYNINSVALTREEVEEELKIIKRKPKTIPIDSVVECYPEEIAVEYYNGTGWKRLETNKPLSQMFMNAEDGNCEFVFQCPSDFASISIGASEGRAIRIQLLKADNCYSRPCNHHYPCISDMKISYSYENMVSTPNKIETISGTERKNITGNLSESRELPFFVASKYNETALYIGFNKKMDRGPISILFHLREEGNFQGTNLTYYYSTEKGFQRLKLVDNTKGMMKTERIVFLPPSDMAKICLEGNNCFWIKIVDESHFLEQDKIYRPIIKNIYMNAINVTNTETLPDSDYYIDEINPYMSFSLYAENVLDATIWVNEVTMLTDRMMQNLLAECPEKLKVEYNLQGGIERFFVRWEEVQNFDQSENKARHYVIDRLTGTVHFGDGIHAQIPRNTKDVAFIATVSCCNGTEGNLAKNEITGVLSNLLFVNNIYNPLKSFGGANMENLSDALVRASNMASNRNRLICGADYEREILSLSSGIAQAKVVLSETKEGIHKDGVINLVILTKDYLENPQAFYRLRSMIKDHLINHCELSIEPKDLKIVAPMLVDISVELWLEVSSMNGTFEMQHYYEDVLSDFLNPYSGEEWDIGNMPRFSQIKMLLHSIKKNAIIRHIMITATYQDATGIHECSLEELKISPFMLCKNGTHKFHFIQK